jgi:hypothetical protein
VDLSGVFDEFWDLSGHEAEEGPAGAFAPKVTVLNGETIVRHPPQHSWKKMAGFFHQYRGN